MPESPENNPEDNPYAFYPYPDERTWNLSEEPTDPEPRPITVGEFRKIQAELVSKEKVNHVREWAIAAFFALLATLATVRAYSEWQKHKNLKEEQKQRQNAPLNPEDRREFMPQEDDWAEKELITA